MGLSNGGEKAPPLGCVAIHGTLCALLPAAPPRRDVQTVRSATSLPRRSPSAPAPAPDACRLLPALARRCFPLFGRQVPQLRREQHANQADRAFRVRGSAASSG